MRRVLSVEYQRALAVQTQVIRLFHQDGIRSVGPARETSWQVGQFLSNRLSTGQGAGVSRQRGWTARHQNAMRPPYGMHAVFVPGTGGESCYLSSPALVFSAAYPSDAALLFRCDNDTGGSGFVIPGQVVVPLLRTYVTLNTITLRRVDGDIALHAYAFSMSLDAESWTWSWSATLRAEALALIQPGGNGDPIEIEANVNGTAYRLYAESCARQTVFKETRIVVKGRGKAAILDAPYAPVLNHGGAADRTAQQLMGDVLTINGVGIGWAIDWGLTDWLVPGSTWTHQGAYISAILNIAQAAGGYVQPHNTAQTLRVLPRYPAAPWAWGTVTPDFELPSAVVAVEGIDWLRKPAYNRVHVSGANNGVLGEVTRAGTAGDLVAPMITDALITHADAARQRGLAVLADTGTQANITLKLPVLAATGLITPGKFVRYMDGAQARLGLVRSTSLEWSRPVLRQTIGIETHIA